MKLFRNPKPVLAAILVFLALFLGTWATQCRAADLDFAAGAAVLRGPAPTIALTVTQRNVVARTGDIQYRLHLVGSSTHKGAEQPNQIFASALLVNGYGRIDLGLGVAVKQHDDAYNSGDLNFALMVKWRATRQLAIELVHYSNAGTRKPNAGRDLLLASWRF